MSNRAFKLGAIATALYGTAAVLVAVPTVRNILTSNDYVVTAIAQLDLFFVEAGRTIASSTVALCQKCPVRRECLDHAYQHEIVSGYFGGISPGRRRVLTHAQAVAELHSV